MENGRTKGKEKGMEGESEKEISRYSAEVALIDESTEGFL